MNAREVNFDGLVGPTHNYAGLSRGNVASTSHRGAVSNPRAAALQGLAKMKFLADLGLPQAVLPPHPRPAVGFLRELGFGGADAEVLAAAARRAPRLLAAAASASSMWAANAATVTPSGDAADGRVHFTPANLAAKLHRSLEPLQTARILRALFPDPARFVIHAPVPGGQAMGDEGAANHTRLAPSHGAPGVHLFVHGHAALARATGGPRKFPSRQAREASEAVARAHALDAGAVLHARLNPAAIDAGVFHHDVIAVGNGHVLLHHEQAYADTRAVVTELRRRFARRHPHAELAVIPVPARRVTLRDAVRSYLFNSQLVTTAPGRMALIAPADCRAVPAVRDFARELVESGGTPIQEVHYLDLRQSMRNGGGPACLRLRVVLTDAELAAVPAGVRLTGETHARLAAWVRRHYRDRLAPRDLADPQLLAESQRALDELTRLLGLGSIYPFQQG
ncbi:MAG: N-succinylarginine dihydrolase [Opitutaceae bacterium]|nr:N-succinylarginine dihydrolase [Opitutaceae bacterium]